MDHQPRIRFVGPAHPMDSSSKSIKIPICPLSFCLWTRTTRRLSTKIKATWRWQFKPIQREGNWDQLVLKQYYTFGVDIHYKSGKKHICWETSAYLLAISLFFQVAQPHILGTSATPGAPNPSADFKLCTWGSTRVRLRTKETIWVCLKIGYIPNEIAI